MTVGFGGPGWERLWLNREATTNERGHFEFRGDCGLDHIVVEIDQSIADGFSEAEVEERLVEILEQIRNAARRKYRDCEAYEEYPRPDRRILRIALTDQDLAQSQE